MKFRVRITRVNLTLSHAEVEALGRLVAFANANNACSQWYGEAALGKRDCDRIDRVAAEIGGIAAETRGFLPRSGAKPLDITNQETPKSKS